MTSHKKGRTIVLSNGFSLKGNEKNMSDAKAEEKADISYKCPNCGGICVEYHYGKRKPVCKKCGTPVSNFVRD